MHEEILELVKKMVGIGSVNTTSGEKDIACFIEGYLRQIPYFQRNPDKVIIQKLDDSLDRRNVIAWIKGEKGDSRDTLIFHGHTDTVGIEDYGALKEYAFDCEKLMEQLGQIDLPEEVEKDLHSGDYLFGRGACDMKSGDAVFMVLAKHICEHIDKLDGNIILSFNPVEENLHTGIIKAGEIFRKLHDEEHLHYLFAINNDYICPLYPEDTTKYVYTGAVGKLLPCFYIQGKETHVGQCFEGFDASLAASELVNIIDLNPDFCEGYKGEYTLPPSVLKMKDLKEQYNVQTSFSNFVYFNYFIHNASVKEIMQKLRDAAKQALDNTNKKIDERYRKFCELSNIEYSEIKYEVQVLGYDELLDKAQVHFHGNLQEYINKLEKTLTEKGTDKREIPLGIVRELCNISKIKKPTVVIFFAAPYCPHNTLKSEIESEDRLYLELDRIITEFAKESEETYQMLQFFPSLSDSSYLKIDDDEESIQMLKDNFPQYASLYNVELNEIKGMNIPGINYGCYGKDAHKWTERVYMPYSYQKLPKLIEKTVKHFLDFQV